MNLFDIQMIVFESATSAVEFAVNWLLQSTLLIAVGLTIGRLLRQRGSAVQSLVYRTTLVAVFICPLTTWGLSQAGVSGWSVELSQDWGRHRFVEIVELDKLVTASVNAEPVFTDAIEGKEFPVGKDEEFSKSPPFNGRFPIARKTKQTNEAGVFAAGPLAAKSFESLSSSVSLSILGSVALVVLVIWFCISIGLTTRLAAAWVRLGRLRRQAMRADVKTFKICHECASRLGVSAPNVLRSPYLLSPCLAGIRQPTVLLPEIDLSLSIRDVFIHELAHLRRRDCHWNLFRKIATAVFFFQPLLWILSRRLEVTAEEVCDDYVVEFGGNRKDYAHRLVDIAELASAQIAPACVGIVSVRSMLATRVSRIMDTSRTLSTRVGNLLLITVIAGGLIATTIAGRVGLGPHLPQAIADENVEPVIKQKNNQSFVSGKITLADGKAASNAHVAVIANPKQYTGDRIVSKYKMILVEGTTDDNGSYRLSIDGASSKTHQYASVIARKDDVAMAWKRLNLDDADAKLSLELQPEEPIIGKLVDIEGQPAAGVQLRISSTMMREKDGLTSDDAVFFNGEKSPSAWLQSVSSNEQGRFTIHGVPHFHGIILEVANNDRFAPQGISLNTGEQEQRDEQNTNNRFLIKNVERGEEAILALAPAQFFEGVVIFEDTGLPAPYARVEISASQDEFGGMAPVAGYADAEGRYRISPKPGIRFSVTAYPPDGAPYLARELTREKKILWQDGDISRQVNISLPRGVLVKGKIVEAGNNTPVPGTFIQYVPEFASNPNIAADIVTGWQVIQISNELGEFEIGVLPGKGRLLVHDPQEKYVMQEFGARQLTRGQPGGERNYAHAVHEINPVNDKEEIDVTISLQSGSSVTGQIVDEQGVSVDETLVITRLTSASFFSFSWSGVTAPTFGGRFELSCLEKGKEYPVHFLDAKRRLGATVDLRASRVDQTVVLRPCGEAQARIVDSEGKPRIGIGVGVEMVVTPGPHKIDREAAKRGELLSDATLIATIDRTHYRPGPKTDQYGNISFPALIPGATYRITIFEDETKPKVQKQFSVKSGESLKLGDITIPENGQRYVIGK